MRRLNLVIIVAVCSLCSCFENEAYQIVYIQNKSEKAIYYGVSNSYPDTSLLQISVIPGKDGNISHKVDKNSQKSTLAAIFGLNSTLELFVFDADTIEQVAWDSIVKYHKVLKRFELNKNDMKENNWTITYP